MSNPNGLLSQELPGPHTEWHIDEGRTFSGFLWS